MSQHDFTIDNQSAPASRADINNALKALASLNSGITAPATAYANMLWYDTATDLLKIRNEANSAWITVGTVDQTNSVFNPNFLPATQAEAEAGTNNVKGMTALRVAQAIATLSPAFVSGVNIQSFTASGTYTPTAGYKFAIGFVTGGGEGGQGGTGGGAGDGGGAGNTVIGTFSLVSLAAQTITIGAGGGSSLVNGGTSSIGTILSASGGGAATAFTGLIQILGGLGGFSFDGGRGGSSFWGGGGMEGRGGGSHQGRAYGSGGSGGYSASSTYTGGTGESGIVMIMEFK